MAHLTSDDGFYHADRARNIAIGNGSANTTVLMEINALQEAVDAAAKGGFLILDSEAGPDGILPGDPGDTGDEVDSPMTAPPVPPETETIYYKVWSDKVGSLQNAMSSAEESALVAADIEMNRVIAYFSRRGYLISRERYSTMANRIKWIIKW